MAVPAQSNHPDGCGTLPYSSLSCWHIITKVTANHKDNPVKTNIKWTSCRSSEELYPFLQITNKTIANWAEMITTPQNVLFLRITDRTQIWSTLPKKARTYWMIFGLSFEEVMKKKFHLFIGWTFRQKHYFSKLKEPKSRPPSQKGMADPHLLKNLFIL